MKKIKILISLLIIFTLQVNVVHAQSIEQNEMSPYNRLEEKIELKKGPVLEINNTYNPLFLEFTNKKDAFSYVKDNYDEILLEISEKEKLDSLNYSNWEKYYLSLQNNYIFSENTPYKLDDIMFLNEFFVVCENEEINQKALEIIKKENYSINELENYIPYTSPILKTKTKIKIQATNFSYNKSAAINYAKTYGPNYNKKYTYYSGKDCTNFASQVLFAGGAPKDSTWKPYTATWTAAHNFTVYWYSRSNSQYATGSFNSLTANCSPGDFIIGDWERDGRYNHVAFVAASGKKTSAGYYDLTIAQHTSNYCAKISSSACGWENTSGLYVRIRF